MVESLFLIKNGTVEKHKIKCEFLKFICMFIIFCLWHLSLDSSMGSILNEWLRKTNLDFDADFPHRNSEYISKLNGPTSFLHFRSFCVIRRWNNYFCTS